MTKGKKNKRVYTTRPQCTQPLCPNDCFKIRGRYGKHCAVHTEGEHQIPSELVHATMNAVRRYYLKHPLKSNLYVDITAQSSLRP